MASGAPGEVIVGGVVPQDTNEMIIAEISSSDEKDDSADGDPSSQEEMEDDEVVVVGTIPCPMGEKVNEKQGEQPR